MNSTLRPFTYPIIALLILFVTTIPTHAGVSAPFTGGTSTASRAGGTSAPEIGNLRESSQRVEDLLAQMTLEEKVGQMFMINIYGIILTEGGAKFIMEQHPGAVAIFGYNTDYQSAGEIAAFINQMQETATTSGTKIPLIVAADQEGGRVRRIVNDVTAFPDPLGLGATTEPESVARIGAAVGAQLKAIGVNMNLAPVADLGTRADAVNKYRVMHRRTFGDDPDRVGWQVAAYSDGLAESGVIGVVKHYPGHGGTADSHAGLPRIDTAAETARATALRAFEVAVENGVPAIMAGHLYYSEIEPEQDLPATLSPTLVRILREDFGFEGVIMTDAMDMGALADNFYVPDAALMAVEAGVDMIVVGPYMTAQMQRDSMARLVRAVREGELSESRLDQSVRRILAMKESYGILDWIPTGPETVSEQIDLEAGEAALTQTYLEAATLVRDDSQLLPLEAGQSIAIIYPAIFTTVRTTCEPLTEIDFFAYTYQPANWEYGWMGRIGRDHDKVVIVVEDAILNPRQADLVLLLPPEKTIVVAMGLPYDLEMVGEVSTFVALYSGKQAIQKAICPLLFGTHPFQGRLPVAVGEYPTGSGIDLKR